MADVEMKDADTPTAAKGKEVGDKKPRFEVKKVSSPSRMSTIPGANLSALVERSRLMVLGHHCRNLCYLPKPHYGALY